MVGAHTYVAWQTPAGVWRLDGYRMSSYGECQGVLSHGGFGKPNGECLGVRSPDSLLVGLSLASSHSQMHQNGIVHLLVHIVAAGASGVVRTSQGVTPGDLGSGEQLSSRNVSQTADGIISFSFFRPLKGTGDCRRLLHSLLTSNKCE